MSGRRLARRASVGIEELAPQRPGTDTLVCEEFEYIVERSGRLAYPDERHIHRRKQRAMPRDRLGKAVACKHGRPDFPYRGPQPADVRVIGEQIECIMKSSTGAQ